VFAKILEAWWVIRGILSPLIIVRASPGILPHTHLLWLGVIVTTAGQDRSVGGAGSIFFELLHHMREANRLKGKVGRESLS